MTATNHALTGAVIALAVKQPALAIPLALVSHFVCDAIPHFDTEGDVKLSKRFIAADLLIAAIAIFSFTFLIHLDIPRWLMLICMAIATSPDAIWGWRYYKFKDFKKIISEPMSKFSKYHQKIQWSETKKGIYVEILWAAAMLFLVARLR